VGDRDGRINFVNNQKEGSEMKENKEQYKIGDIVLLHTKYRHETEVRAAQIRSIRNGLFGFTGTFQTDFHPSGQGAFTIEQIGAKPFGLQRVEFLCKGALPNLYATCSPRPGDTAYDLMC
jgi:hypothetical protein